MSKRKSRQFRGTKCLNCETALDISEKYCHQCGQLNSTKKLTISDFFEEFLSNFYAYDSRLRNSIISIFTKPGVLAREFNKGKRQKYANPFRLFLSVSIMLFISFNLSPTQETFSDEKQNADQIENDLYQKDTLTYSSLKKLKRDSLHISKDSIYTSDFINKNLHSNIEPLTYRISSFRNYSLKYPEKEAEDCLSELGFDNNYTNKFLYNKSKLFKTNNISDELIEFFFQKLPFLIFLSLPIITIIFWLVYIRKKINYTEHLVFSYTYFTFMFICMIIFNLFDFVSPTLSYLLSSFSFLILFPIYFYKSLRNFYQQGRWKTILKFVILNPLFGIFLFISAIIMMFIGIILF